jgi:hypothetical protein
MRSAGMLARRPQALGRGVPGRPDIRKMFSKESISMYHQYGVQSVCDGDTRTSRSIEIDMGAEYLKLSTKASGAIEY